MVRTRLDPADRLSEVVSLKLRPVDKTAWLAKVKLSGLSASEYFRTAVLENRATIIAVERDDTVQLRLLGILAATERSMEALVAQAQRDRSTGTLSEAGYQTLVFQQLELLTSLREAVLRDH